MEEASSGWSEAQGPVSTGVHAREDGEALHPPEICAREPPMPWFPRLYVGADRACISGGLGGMTERCVGRTQHSCSSLVAGLLPGGAPEGRRLVLGQRLGDLAAAVVPRPPGRVILPGPSPHL